MKDGICPKCGSNDVRSNIYPEMTRGFNRIFIDWSFLGGRIEAGLDIYVCATCGYVESYIAKEKDLSKIVEKWPRVGDEKRKRDEL